MEQTHETLTQKIKLLAGKIADDNLFLQASSVSYYSALALAPFLLILLWVASILGQDMQVRIINHATTNFSPQVGEMFELVFRNINSGVNLGSISGIVGFAVLLSTCSLVFLQFRHAFDVIYGYYDPDASKTALEFIVEKLFAMLAVFCGVILLIASFTIVAVVEYFWGPDETGRAIYRNLAMLLNFCIYLVLFTGLHMFTPSKRQKFKSSVKIAAFTSVCFMIGNVLLASYLKTVAKNSVYGAAGTLLVFLVWAYYSSFIIFLSVEVFCGIRRARRRP